MDIEHYRSLIGSIKRAIGTDLKSYDVVDGVLILALVDRRYLQSNRLRRLIGAIVGDIPVRYASKKRRVYIGPVIQTDNTNHKEDPDPSE